jgi:hypothetical protein
MPEFEILNSSTSKSLTTANYVKFPSLTQTQVDALTSVPTGVILHNSTIGELRMYNGTI